MTATDVVRVDDLRLALRILLDEVERVHGNEVHLDADFYWHLDVGVIYNALVKPETDSLSLGSILDDVDELHGVIDKPPEDLVSLWHDLAHVIGILRRIAKLDLDGAHRR